MSQENDRQERSGGKWNEHTPAPQVWIGDGKIVTMQTNGPIQVYTERSMKDGSVKTQSFIKTGKP
jgi:hypothetical protein